MIVFLILSLSYFPELSIDRRCTPKVVISLPS